MKIDRPIRTILESIRDAWTAENGSISAGIGLRNQNGSLIQPHAKLIKHPINQFHHGYDTNFGRTAGLTQQH